MYFFYNLFILSISLESTLDGMGPGVDLGLFGFSLFCTITLVYFEIKTH